MASLFQVQLRTGTAGYEKSKIGLHRKNALAVKYLRLILCITPKHIRTTGLEIPRSNQNHIAILDPDPPLHLASYTTESVGSV